MDLEVEIKLQDLRQQVATLAGLLRSVSKQAMVGSILAKATLTVLETEQPELFRKINELLERSGLVMKPKQDPPQKEAEEGK